MCFISPELCLLGNKDMKTEIKTFIFSLLLHLVIVGSAVSFAEIPLPPSKPVLIDFTVENARIADHEASKPDSGGAPPPPRVAPAPKVKTAKAQPAPTVPKSLLEPVATPVPLEISAEAVPVAAPVIAAPVQAIPPAIAHTVTASSMYGNGRVGSGTGTVSGSGTAASDSVSQGESAETLRMRYLKEHFAYIRDLVAGNLKFPGLARRMGWSGKLAVEFVVRQDGTADTVRILKSSGVPLLDSDARDTVMRSAPFPKPPVSARLVLPIEYILEN